ncbi:MAG: tetratricopeptide repeat protein [Planctomycetes bacterium]|nr:tetratricopeptide repeat protein [Planctomycetota bacterium]
MNMQKNSICPIIFLIIITALTTIACTEESNALEGLESRLSDNAETKTDDKKSDAENAEEIEKSDKLKELKKKYTKEEIAKLKEKLYTHKDIENIKNTDERFDYVKNKINEQKDFIKFGLEMVLDGLYQRQQAQKTKQPVFNLIYGYFLFGTSRQDESKKTRGLLHINKAIELDSNFEYAHYVLGDTFVNKYMVSREEGHLKSAIKHYQKALLLRSTFYDVHRSLGITYLETGNYEKAKVEINEAIKLNNEDAQNWIALISIHLRRGEFEIAEKVIDDAQVTDKVKYQAFGRICLELKQKQLYTKAWNIGLKSFKMLKKLASDDLPRDNWLQFYILMAELSYRKSDREIETAQEFLNKVFEVEKTNMKASEILMIIAADTKDVELLDTSIKKWLEFIETEPMKEEMENRIFEWITTLAKILVELEPNKIKGNKELVLILLKWALTVRGDEEDNALKKAGLYLEWMFTLKADTENEKLNYITEIDIKAIENPDDMKLIIKGLFRACKSSQISVLRPTTEYLGAIIRAAKIEEKQEDFKKFVKDIMLLPATTKNNQIKSYLCISIGDFNDKTLLPYVIIAVKQAIDTESTSECHRLLPRAHKMLNSLLNDINSNSTYDRKLKRRQLRIDFYNELYADWLEKLKQNEKTLYAQWEKIVSEIDEKKSADKTDESSEKTTDKETE